MNVKRNKNVTFIDLGLVDYQKAWDTQEKLFGAVIEVKVANRKLDPSIQQSTRNYLLFCEHPHVYTLGKSGDINHLKLNETQLDSVNAKFYKVNRGGDITYHGPGQIVGYPIFDLDHFFTDIHRYLRFLEEAVINTLKYYDVVGGRIDGLTGVWIDFDDPGKARKICALGVKSSRWVTMHGFAFNINTDLAYFNHIIPCGIDDKAVTSLANELGNKVDIVEVKSILSKNIAMMFEANLKQGSIEDMLNMIS